ncbi:hypothetical protein Y1Q_0011059 [Alligator mississippiensis]|uniref:Uncharacterized protein n=1 Tax=Alligator mississippiensis TaxID=8496 RepID=A0A151NXB3_ALLMI|nr:hypothetical protein Y1Q_0011059 [Alligator mississippiensis]
MKPVVVPLWDSKLACVFQGFFTGCSCTIVNISQCTAMYDENLHVAKFLALISQLIQAPPAKMVLLSILREHWQVSQISEAGSKQEVEPEEVREDEADVALSNKKVSGVCLAPS